jgi:hypothetical protein
MPAPNERFGVSGDVACPKICADFGGLPPIRAAVNSFSATVARTLYESGRQRGGQRFEKYVNMVMF